MKMSYCGNNLSLCWTEAERQAFEMDFPEFEKQQPWQFSAALEAARSKVLRMGGVVEEQLGNAFRALVVGDTDLANSVVRNDVRVNGLEVEIDEDCMAVVASHRLDAGDLRMVMAIIKTINDLERIGDEAKRVGKMVQDELVGALNEEVRQELEHMGDLVKSMLGEVLDAFARTDVEAALEVARADYKVDGKYRVITRQLMTLMAEDANMIPSVLRVLWAARAMERIGDRCQNIAEYIIYLVLGKDVRHTSLNDVVTELKAP